MSGTGFSSSDYNSGGDGYGGNGWGGASNSHKGGGGEGSLDNLHAIRGWDIPEITDVKNNKVKNWFDQEVTISVTVTTRFNGELTSETYYGAGAAGKSFAIAAKGLKAVLDEINVGNAIGAMISLGISEVKNSGLMRQAVASSFNTGAAVIGFLAMPNELNVLSIEKQIELEVQREAWGEEMDFMEMMDRIDKRAKDIWPERYK